MENLNIIFLRTWRRKSQAILKLVKSFKALKACKSITNEKERKRGEQNLEEKKNHLDFSGKHKRKIPLTVAWERE